ncbi:hypothetical protein [Pontibacillus salipaludis]|uniref:Uncharacterized protein n=1 Tax=Pontibacillus salipaludis TaxID=1697394 RepID=A0ABQ1Q0R8_9BACI|nr:hypothetical protein [Pontibacillus salipaludis]GGD08150.1 hypothetical protein GCM10011389_14600 [Pontibacillus salipaludis]
MNSIFIFFEIIANIFLGIFPFFSPNKEEREEKKLKKAYEKRLKEEQEEQKREDN